MYIRVVYILYHSKSSYIKNYQKGWVNYKYMERTKQTPNWRLRRAREYRGWTQKDVADNIDLPDKRSLRRWECGEGYPGPHYRTRLCELFAMSVEELGLLPATDVHNSKEENDQPITAAQIERMEEDHLHMPRKHLMPHFKDTNQQRLLEKVQSFWIRGVLEQSLHGTPHLALELHEIPNAIINPLAQVIQLPEVIERPLPSGISITQVFDQACGELLILGDPGSGKTTLLLELARDLLQRAHEDASYPIPVVLNLSSWSTKYHFLSTWLAEELCDKYLVPRRIGQLWIENDNILPLLDGLDEINPILREACIDAVNEYRREHGLVSLVLCSRREDYLYLDTRLLLQRAVCIQPLTSQQVHEYIEKAGGRFSASQAALYENLPLQKFVYTPLMLNILTLTYQDQPVAHLETLGTAEGQQNAILAIYIERMLKHRRSGTHYTLQKSIHWLTWLARQMKQRHQTEFYLERLQLDWLPTHRLNQFCRGLVIGLCAALLSGGLIGLIDIPLDGLITSLLIVPFIAFIVGITAGVTGAMLEGILSTPFKKITVGCIAGSCALGFGLWADQYLPGDDIVFGAVSGLTIILVFLLLSLEGSEIKPTEAMDWSWMRVWKNFSVFLVRGTPIVACVGVIGGLIGWFIGHIGVNMIFILLFATLSLLIAVVLSGFSSKMLDERFFTTPNQGIRRSAYFALLNGLIATLLNWLILTITGKFILSFFPYLVIKPNLLLFSELSFTLTTGLLVGIYRGGKACIKHIVLRIMLWRGSYIPWYYVHFLDYITTQHLMHKVGGGYIFAHQAVTDYLSSLDAESLDANLFGAAGQHRASQSLTAS